MSLIRVKQIEPTELFSFVEDVFSGDVGTLTTDVDFLLGYTSGISGYADTLQNEIDLLSGQVIDLTNSLTGTDARLEIVSGMITDFGVELNSLSGYIDLVSGIAFSFSGLANDAYDIATETADALFNTGAIVDLISGDLSDLSDNFDTLSTEFGVLSGDFTDFTGDLGLTGQQILGREDSSLGRASGVNVGRGLEISGGFLQLDSDCVVYSKMFFDNTTGSTATTIPLDDTIPQSGEGAEVLNILYTPKLPLSNIILDIDMHVSANALVHVSAALFLDSDVDALIANSVTIPSTNYQYPLPLHYVYSNTTSGVKNFKVRVGPHTSTAYWNRGSSARYFGGLVSSSIKITETAP